MGYLGYSLRSFATNNVKHTHTRTKMILPVENIRESKDVSFLYSPLNCLNNLLDAFEFINFEVRYHKDNDAHTEYIIVNGRGANKTEVEIHIFSCYCDGEEDQEVKSPF